MSHRTMNKIIGYSYNFDNDEIVNYFIAFLKSLTVRLDDETIKFFFNEVMLEDSVRSLISFLCIHKLLGSLIILRELLELLSLLSH
jgi:hypothetical protein